MKPREPTCRVMVLQVYCDAETMQSAISKYFSVFRSSAFFARVSLTVMQGRKAHPVMLHSFSRIFLLKIEPYYLETT